MTPSEDSSTSNRYVIDIESGAETARLIKQDTLMTQAMGGLFPEQPDLSSVKRILDLACGPGGWVIDVAFQYPHIQVVGTDINPTMIEYARAQIWSRGYNNAHFQVMDATKPWDFPDASFDMVNSRFIVGFLDRTSWPPLLAECMRVLRPGGKLRFSEAEVGISNSPALQCMTGYLSQTIFRQGRSFSADGQTIGIAHQLGKLFQDAGATQVERRAFCLDSSYGSELYPLTYKNNEITFALLKPYLVNSGIVGEAEYDEQYNKMLIEMLDEEFTCIGFGLTVLGTKPLS